MNVEKVSDLFVPRASYFVLLLGATWVRPPFSETDRRVAVLHSDEMRQDSQGQCRIDLKNHHPLLLSRRPSSIS
jgi:hypothetical protein